MQKRGELMVPQHFLQPPSAPVAIATCSEVVGKESDDLRVIEALQRRGVVAVHAVWDDPDVNWSSFALVVIRSTWDYPERRGEFLAWAKQLRTVLNPWPILGWNTDKRYLDDLARVGLPIIPTRFLEPDDTFEPPPHPFVVKPAVSCGARDTARYEAGDEARACEHVRRLQVRGRTVMVQPYLADIEAKGEVAVMFLGGTYSHSIWRGALLNHCKQSVAYYRLTLESLLTRVILPDKDQPIFRKIMQEKLGLRSAQDQIAERL